MIYLAHPYSHKDAAIREARFQSANRIAGILMKAGKLIFSPISHTHPIALVTDLPVSWEFWKLYDLEMLKACEALIVVTAEGWKESIGVQAEMEIMRELNRPIIFYEPTEEEVPWNRQERCYLCGNMASYWVQPDWASDRVCLPCESAHEPK